VVVKRVDVFDVEHDVKVSLVAQINVFVLLDDVVIVAVDEHFVWVEVVVQQPVESDAVLLALVFEQFCRLNEEVVALLDLSLGLDFLVKHTFVFA